MPGAGQNMGQSMVVDGWLHDLGLKGKHFCGAWLGMFHGVAWTRLCAACIGEAADALRPFHRYAS